MAKAANPAADFVKYFKNLYSTNIQLNIGDWFMIYYDSHEGYDNDVRVYVPTDRNSKLQGTIDLSACPAFDEWMRRKGGGVIFDNEVLDALRKKKMSELVGIDYADDYKFIVTVAKEDGDGTEDITFEKRGGIPRPVECDFKYEIDIPAEALEKPLLVVGIKDDKPTLDRVGIDERIFDSPVKNLDNVFKKDAKYVLKATERDAGGFRRIAFTGKGTQCELTQYFTAMSY